MLEVKEEELNKILPSDGPSIDEVKRYLDIFLLHQLKDHLMEGFYLTLLL